MTVTDSDVMSSNQNQHITVTQQAGVGYLTLDRPPVNVINIAMLREIEAALVQMAQWSGVRVLVLQAAGKLFSAGVDIADHTDERVGAMIPLFNHVCQALADFPRPTIAAVQGHALGGGCEFVICCDLAVMAESAKIGQPEIQLASFAPVAALRLPYLVGYRAAADFMFNGRNLPASKAYEIGLINAVVPLDEVADWANSRADHLASLSQPALTLAKQALSLGYGNWARDMQTVERLYLDDLMSSVDAHEGLAAFLEKRQPVWQHR